MRKIITTSVIGSMLVTACAVAPALPSEQRPNDWAKPVGSEVLRQALPNLYQVSPVLYRSAQPEVEGLLLLNQQSARVYGLPAEIKTVLSLRNNAGDAALVKPSGVRYEQIRFNTWMFGMKTSCSSSKSCVILPISPFFCIASTALIAPA